MAKPKKATVVQASDSQQSSPLPELANKKKQNAPIVQAPSKGKPAQKPAPQKQQSEEETPVQEKKKVVKAPRKGSKASVDEDTPAPAARKGSVDKPNAKKPIKAKEPSSEEEQVKPKKAVVAKKPLKPAKDESESSEQEVVKKPAPKAAQKPVAVNLKNKKKQESEEQSQDEIIAPKKKVVVPQTKDKKEVKKNKQQSQSEEEAPKKVVAKPQAKKVVKPESESEQQSSQQKPKPVRKGSKEVAAKKAVKVVAKQQSEQQQKPKTRKASKDAIKTEAKKPAKKVQESEQQQSEQQKPQPTKKKAVPKKIEQQEESEEEKPAPKRKGSADVKKAAKQQPVAEEEEEQGQFEVAVQGLSFNAFDADVRDLFDSCGNILNVKLISRPDGKPKGFAFVKFSTKSSFNKALELNGTEHMGRQIRVEEARNNNQKQDQRGGNNRNGGQAPTGDAVIETPTLFIGGLSYNSTVDSIKQFFSSSGEVQSARIVTDKQSGKPRGFGYVEFFDVDSAKKAYQELNGQYLDGRQIRLDSAAQRDRPQGGNFGNRQGGGFGGNGGGFRNNNNRQGSAVALSQDDRFAKKGAIASFAGKKIQL